MEWARVPGKPGLNFSPGPTSLLKSARTWVSKHWITPSTYAVTSLQDREHEGGRTREASRGVEERKSKPHLMKSEGRAGLHGSSTFWHQQLVSWKTIFPRDGSRGWFEDDSNALHFYYYYISSTSDHQSLDPGGWGPLDQGKLWPGQVKALGATIPQSWLNSEVSWWASGVKGLPFQLGKRKRISEPETASWKSPVKKEGHQFSTILGCGVWSKLYWNLKGQWPSEPWVLSHR